MTKRLIPFALILFLLADLGYSFLQHSAQPLDGDMAWNIVPASDVAHILENPFGTGVILKHESYPNPNRFFCHYAMKSYFDAAPLFLQKFTDPVNSIYLSCALVKIVIQIFLIFLLAMAVSGTWNVFSLDFLIAATLVTPFFQTNGYQSYMGIIDRSPTYTFFYALPCAFLLLYFLPFIRQYYHNIKPGNRVLIHILWIPLAIVISLSGPLNPGVVLICTLLLLAGSAYKIVTKQNHQGFFRKMHSIISTIPRNYWFFLMPAAIFSLYSLYLGSYNTNDIHVPLGELYSRLPAGLYYPFTKKLGFPVIFAILSLNYFIINRNFKTPEGKKILTIFQWMVVFSVVYFLLLPLGGSRDNRPNVLRYDTMMPFTISLIMVFGISALFLIKNLAGKQKKWFLAVVFGVLLLFTINDEALFDKNQCERAALMEISKANGNTVRLPGDCKVLSWKKTATPEESKLNSELLTMWRVTKVNTLYYNE